MRLDNQQESENVEDRRSMSGGGMAVGGGLGTLVLVLIVWALGGDPRALLQQIGQQQGQQQGQPMQPGPQQGPPQPGKPDPLRHFVAVVLGDTEVVWSEQLPKQKGIAYRKPKLVLFNGEVNSACGFSSAAVGPFYCPEDEKVYLDLSFYRELKTRFGAPGDFAQAYVIAHEVGHHVQKLLGISDKVDALRRRASKAQANALSVRLELQADFFAGVWAHHAQERFQFLDPDDIDDALAAPKRSATTACKCKPKAMSCPTRSLTAPRPSGARWFERGFDRATSRRERRLMQRSCKPIALPPPSRAAPHLTQRPILRFARIEYHQPRRRARSSVG